MIAADKKFERLIRVARMYYEQNMNQSAIARELGISRPLVSVLLSEARETGIVTITINQAENAQQLLAQRMETRFGISQVLILPDEESGDATNNAIAQAAFRYCFGGENPAKRVGVGWGSLLGRMTDYAESLEDGSARTGGFLCPLIGGIGASYRGYHTNEIVRILSAKAGLPAEYLYMPAFFDSESELKFAHGMETYQSLYEKWEKLDLAVVNISNFPSYPDLGVRYRFGNRLTKEGAVCRILAHYFCIDGGVIEANVDNVVQASTEQLKKAKTTFAVCSTLLRPQSVMGAMASGMIDALMLPQSLAEQILDME